MSLEEAPGAYNSVELAPLVALRPALRIFALASAKLPEVLCRTWSDIGKQFHLHST